MLPGARTPAGALYITQVAPSSLAISMGGISVEPDGAINVTTGLPDLFVNGFGATTGGVLSIDLGGLVDKFQQGLPFNSSGQLVCQLNQPENADDAYVGGIRVDSVGGVYVVDTTPPVPRAFDSGFDSGFGV